MIKVVATSSERSSANLSELFHSGKLVLKMNLKDDGRSWFGFQMGYQPKKINFSIAPALPQSIFKSSVSLLYAYSESWIEVCPSFFFCQEQGNSDFQFKSDHMKGKIIWKNQFVKAISAFIFASARRWKKIISECPPRFAMSLCSQASLLSSKLTK